MASAPPIRPASSLSVNGLLERATAAAGIGAWAYDLADDRLTWSEGVYDLFGIVHGAPVERGTALAMYDPQSRLAMEKLRATAIETGHGFSLDARIVRTDGAARWMRLTAEVERRAGRAVRLYGIKQDITHDRARWDDLRRRADRDALTGLYGRAAFQHRFLDGDAAEFGALALFDLDDFKLINDRFGHSTGDACLRAIGARLTSALPAATMIARIGGDEFAALFPAQIDPDDLCTAIDGALADCAAPVVTAEASFVIGASAGLVFATPECDPDLLFDRADAALYAAKRSGRGHLRIAPRIVARRRA